MLQAVQLSRTTGSGKHGRLSGPVATKTPVSGDAGFPAIFFQVAATIMPAGGRKVATLLAMAFILSVGMAAPAATWAHGFAGERFFPATLAIDDPFVADEGDLLFSHGKAPNDDGELATTDAISPEYAKRVTRNFGLSVATQHQNIGATEGSPSLQGWSNFEIGARYLSLVSAEYEALVSVGLNVELGRTGSKQVSDSFSTISPSLLFGKGFGDLPSSLEYWRPFAITGVVSPNITTRASAPDSLTWGFTLQYNLQYLQVSVKDIGLSAPFDHVVLLVETPMSTCIDQGCAGQITGTINPGFVWFSRWGQLGLEAAIPVNERSGGSHVGLLFQLHFYFDDIFSRTFGAPLIQ